MHVPCSVFGLFVFHSTTEATYDIGGTQSAKTLQISALPCCYQDGLVGFICALFNRRAFVVSDYLGFKDSHGFRCFKLDCLGLGFMSYFVASFVSEILSA